MNRWTLTNTDTGEILELAYDPKGWDEVILTHERDEKWHGVFYGFSQELGFFCKGGGKEFVDDAYDESGQEANVRLKLETQCNGQWSTVLEGKVNFSSYRQEYVSNVLYTYLNVENDDIATLLKNREDTKVNLLETESLSGVALNSYTRLNYDVNLHSKIIKVQSKYVQTNNELNACAVFDTSINNIHLAEWNSTLKEIDNSQDVIPGIESASVSSTSFQPLIEVTGDYIYPIDITIDWNFDGSFYGDIRDAADRVNGECGTGTLTPTSINIGSLQNIPNGPSGAKIYLILKIGQEFDTATGRGLVELDGTGGSVLADTFGDTFNGVGSITTSLNIGDKVWLMWMFAFSITTGGGTRDATFNVAYNTGEINFTALTASPATVGKATAIHEAWSRLCEMITDQPLAFKSEFFGRRDSQGISYNDNGYGAFTAVTPGKAIRGFTDYRFETSLSDMFESCWSVWGTGLGVELHNGVYVARVEEMSYFYSGTLLFTFDYVSRIQMRHIQDKVYNEVEMGYQKWQTENVNGLDEPNSKVTWAATFIKSNKNRFEGLSPYVGGMYALELTRREGVSTEDTRYDEEIFFICLSTITTDNSGYNAGTPTQLDTPEKDEHFSPGSITGLISPETAYNLRLMPNLNYQRLANQFTGGWVKLSPSDVKLSQTEGNISVTYIYAPTNEALRVPNYPGSYNGTVQTNVSDKVYIDTKMGARGYPLWEPEEYTFEYPLEFSDYLLFLANPYGLIKFSDTNKNYLSGWVTKLEYNLKYKKGNFTILRKYGS